mmetsp:Transcript_27490/g.64146  ORF Transcript_27490/g.64146 Transcript_27490/m.64146 type:complete len:497 (-) Transcript_27490:209-1699(-)
MTWHAHVPFPEGSLSSVLISLLLVLLALWLCSSLRSSRCQAPLAAGAKPLVGHALGFGSDPRGLLLRCKAECGDAFRLRFFGNDVLVVTGKYMRTFFANQDALSFDEAIVRTIGAEHTVGSDAVFNPWHVPVLRRELGPSNVESYFRGLPELIERVLSEDGVAVDGLGVCEDLTPLAWSIVASCSATTFVGPVLGLDPGLLDVFVTFHKACFAVINASAVLPQWAVRIIASRRVRRCTKFVARLLTPEIERRRTCLELGEPLPNDLLARLMEARDKKSGELHSPAAIAKRMMTLVFASMVTTAGVLAHALWDLSGRQEQWAPLLEEQREVVCKHGSSLTKGALDDCEKLHAFLWESMRHASLPVQQARFAVKTFDLDGIEVPKGTMILMSGLLSSEDESVFTNASSFLPQRFLRQDGRLIDAPERVGFFPFGIGRRICAGRHFALSEVKMTICTLLRHFHLETLSGRTPAYRWQPGDTERIPEAVRFERRKLEDRD